MKTASTAPASRAGSLPLVGSRLALDFVNTSSGRGGSMHKEHLREAAHVAMWARHAGIISEADAVKMTRLAATRPDFAEALLTRALDLREAIHRVAAALASGRAAGRKALGRLSRIAADCMAAGVLAPKDGNFVWTWSATAAPVEAALGPIALSALVLLRGADLTRLKQCPGEHCGWLFFDTTKNRSRRWCEMEVCGNRAKQRRLQSRKKRA